MVFCPGCGSLLRPFETKCKRCGYDEKGDNDEADVTDINIPSTVPKVVEEENPENPYFPYKPRDKQMDIVNDMYSAFQRGEHIVVESGTGTGKTIVSLSAALNHAIPNRKKVIYLSRTITQSDQVMRELRSISKLRPVSGITITGRGRSCPYLRTLENYENIPANVLANLCEENKKKALANIGGCPFYRSMKEKLDSIERYCKNNLPTSSELDTYCEDNGVCPYETKKALLKSMTVITAPYIQILSEDIRKGFLGNLESDGTDLIAVVDEAHNIIDAAREQESYSITLQLVNNANDEVTTFRSDPEIFDNVHLGQFITEIKMIMRSFANEKITLTKKEEILEPKALEDRLRKKFNLDPTEMTYAIDRMISIGEDRTDMMMEKGENKVSEIFTLAIALKNWILSDPGKYIKSVKAGENGESLHAACIDPTDVTYFLRSIKGVVHMSGTLDPPAQYAKVMGLPNGTVLRKYPSPFPPENRSVVYVRDVSTRYEDMKKDPKIQERIQSYIVRLCNNVQKNTLVFFPSYGMMTKMRPYIEKYLDKDLYWEESRQPRRTAANLIKFRKGRNGVFFTVMGGSIAEGIDFPGEELCFSIIVGIPYPPPTLELKAMATMFDERYGYGAGWRYASEIPALRKMQQAIGRMIRTETDRGMAVILDSRAEKYQLKLGAKASVDPISDAVRFFMEQ